MKRLKGINTDTDPIDQPEGSYRDAQNAVISERLGAISSEGGTVSRDAIPSNYKILGDTLVYDGRNILFLAGKTGTAQQGQSEIGIFDGQSYTSVLSNNDLNFDPSSVVEAVNIVNNQGEVVVYWTDGVNPPRYYNIDDPVAVTNISTTNLFPTISNAPYINLDGINSSGGTLKSGAYYFAVSYIAEDNSRTNYMSITPPIYINDDGDPDNHDIFDGVPAGTQTSKAIRLKLENLDTTYKNFQLAVVRKEGGTIASVDLVPEQSINGSDEIYTYTGSESTVASSLDEIVINTASYKTAGTIAEQDNTLYLGNLSKNPDIGYQKYANNIEVHSYTKELEDGDKTVNDGAHYGDGEISFHDKSFKRGEVYAFYIAFVLKNGQETQAYHIPGRRTDGASESSTATFGVEKYKLKAELGTNNMGFWENEDETYPDTDDFDVYDVQADGTGTQVDSIRNENVRHHHFPENQDKYMYHNNSKNFVSMGVNLKNIKIPANVIDQVRGVKIYYAKRTSNNRRVVDSGVAVCMKKVEVDDGMFDGDPYANIPDDFVLTHEHYNENENIQVNGIFVYGFNSLRTRKNIGSVTHVKYVADEFGDSEDFSKGGNDNIWTFFDQTENVYQNMSPTVYGVKAITYCEKDSFINNAVSSGFSYNINNLKNGPVIAVELDELSALNVFSNPGDSPAQDVSLSKYVDLIQLQSNMYFPFDQQELISTGYMETDIDRFDPRLNSTGGGNATGSIDITSGVAGLAPTPQADITIPNDAQETGEYAQGYIEVTATALAQTPSTGAIDVTANNLASGASENHNLHVAGNATAAITINDTDTLQDIVNKYVSEINNDATISVNWTASAVDNGDGTWKCLIEGVNGDESLDGSSISVSGNVDITVSVTSPTSGANDGTETETISIDGNTVDVTVDYSMSIQDIVNAYRDAVNNDAIISTDWTASSSNSSGQWRCVITANATGTTWNGKVIDVTNVTDVTLTTSDTSGGVDSVQYAGTIQIDISSPYAEISVSHQISNALAKGTIATELSNALNGSDAFSFGFTASVDNSGADPVVHIEANSNGNYYNSTLTVTDDSGSGANKDGDIDGGTDNGALEFRQSVGYLEVLSGSATAGNSDIDITVEPPPFRSSFTDTVTVTVGTGDSANTIAGKILTALLASSTLSEYTFFVNDNKVFIYYDGNNAYEGVGFTFQTAGGDPVSYVVDLQNHYIQDGRSGTGASPSIRIGFTTPNDNFYVNVNVSIGDDAATVESKVKTALQGDVTFTNYYSATGADPITITADSLGTQYNGSIDLIDNDTGVQAVIQNLTGGQDSSVVSQFNAVAFGGDTFISYLGWRMFALFVAGNVAGFPFCTLFYNVVESDDNIKLRHQGTGKEEIYYPKSSKSDIVRFEEDIKTDQDPEDLIYANYIGYNQDYSSQASIKSAIPSSKNKEDVTKYPTRIIRSAEGDTTQGDTGIRTFLENDYIDLTGSRGELVKLVVMQNTLMPHMERSLIRTRGREELTTGDFRAFIGAGDIFSVKPNEVLSTKEGFAGLQDKRCSIVTPAGYFFVDRQAGDVILMGQNGPEIVSEHGLTNFFKDELIDAPDDKLICGYDNEQDRILLTYKGKWTISYYPALKAWASFHSYDPDYYLYDLDTFYTLKTDTIYEHNIYTSPCHFYGSANPDDFYIEFVENRSPQITKRFVNIEYIAEVEDSSNNKIWNETFDKFRIQNDRQDSGLKDIIYFTGANGNARNVEGTWKINNFRNMLVNGVVDPSKPWQDQDRFVGKWVKVKLIFNNSNQKSIYLYDSSASARRSIR